MTGTLLIMLKITIIVTLVVEWWCVPTELYNSLMTRLLGRPTHYVLIKPFSCGVCMTFWSCLTYVLLYNFNFDCVFFCFIFAYIEPFIYCFINKVDFLIRYILK